MPSRCRCYRGLNRPVFNGKIMGRLVCFKGHQFADQLAENIGWRIFIPQDGKFVVYQRMIQNCKMHSHIFMIRHGIG